MYKALIFDFFDVIHADHQKAWLKKHGFKREGGFAEASDLLDIGKIDRRTYIERYAKLSGKTAAEVEQEFEELSYVDQAVVDLLFKLKGKYRLGLLSNSHAEEIRPILNHHDFIALFDEVIISAEVELAKPDPEIFTLALKLLNVLPEETIFVDDSKRNIEAAELIGITGIWYVGIDSLQDQLRNLGIEY